MKIAIIGAGFTGLTAALRLTEAGHHITVIEKDSHPGGLAIGFKEKEWEWTLEKHYHHWFTNDKFILGLAQEIGHKVIIKRPESSVYIDGKIFQFDSPKQVLLFPKLPLIDRIRMAGVIGLIRYNPFWKPLEKINASTFLPKAMGRKAYKMIWEPQFLNKFGRSAGNVSLAWLWARIAKRTPSLAYPEGGFLNFANHLVKTIEEKGGKVILNSEIVEVKEKDNTVEVASSNMGKKLKIENYDRVIFTLSSFLFLKITPQLPAIYKSKFLPLKNLGATNLVLRLKKPFLRGNTYWLSICDSKAPIMAVVEHTNFMNKTNYNNEHLVYLGNYYETNDPRFLMTKEAKLKLIDPFLKKINPSYKKNLIGYELFKAPFAQPVIPTNYSKMIPSMTTPLKNVYLANMQQVYPWDRGTNYAVELGEKVARLISNS